MSTRRLRHYNPLILAFPELVEIDKAEVSGETKEMDNHKEVDTTKALHTIATEIQAFLELLLIILLMVGAFVVEVDDLDVDYCRSPWINFNTNVSSPQYVFFFQMFSRMLMKAKQMMWLNCILLYWHFQQSHE